MYSKSHTIVHPTILREYIGAKSDSDLPGFPHIINPKVKEFHFVLAFATEDYDETTKKGDGTFNPSWDLSTYNAESIQKLKNKHKNAKVLISIGGRGSEYPFNPEEKMIWLDNAKNSLKQILNEFNESCGCANLIDGIDVHYEHIVASNDFVDSIGKLIKSLKKNDHIKMVSISPSKAAQPQYKKLYQTYRNYIDWVDYQFYDQTVSTKQEFERLYNILSNDYPHNILLAGFSTDPSDAGKISKEVFLEGCQDLFRRKLLPGISIWDAEDSQVPIHGNPFQVEKLAQQMIVDFNHTKK